MIVDLDYRPGMVFVRDSQAVLGITSDVLLTPDQARVIARKLEAEGKHTVAAAGLMRAADDAERWV